MAIGNNEQNPDEIMPTWKPKGLTAPESFQKVAERHNLGQSTQSAGVKMMPIDRALTEIGLSVDRLHEVITALEGRLCNVLPRAAPDEKEAGPVMAPLGGASLMSQQLEIEERRVCNATLRVSALLNTMEL